ncbi:hypothetical protein RCH10_003069 [Variovorax sp. GrIS 2.14]
MVLRFDKARVAHVAYPCGNQSVIEPSKASHCMTGAGLEVTQTPSMIRMSRSAPSPSAASAS